MQVVIPRYTACTMECTEYPLYGVSRIELPAGARIVQMRAALVGQSALLRLWLLIDPMNARQELPVRLQVVPLTNGRQTPVHTADMEVLGTVELDPSMHPYLVLQERPAATSAAARRGEVQQFAAA